MARERHPIDISNVPELLRIAEEVRSSGEPRLLKHGEQDLAVLTPVKPESGVGRGRRRRGVAGAGPDSLLNIIGIGESAEPTDIGQHKDRYLAEAYDIERP